MVSSLWVSLRMLLSSIHPILDRRLTMTGSLAMFKGLGSWSPLIISRHVGYVSQGRLLRIPKGKSPSIIGVVTTALGMYLTKDEGSEGGALSWAGWAASAYAYGGGGLTTLTAEKSVTFPSSFRDMTGLYIKRQLLSFASNLPPPKEVGNA